MKNQTQPQHTQGEWSYRTIDLGHTLNYLIEVKNFYPRTDGIKGENTNDEDYHFEVAKVSRIEANAQRIVTCVNEYEALKKKADMHDEMVEVLKIALSNLKEGAISTKDMIEQLLKQAEQK